MACKRILVVEDYPQLRDLIAVVLREVGRYAVQTAGDGGSAERLIAERTFDLLVLDIGVPGLVGAPEIASSARERFRCPIIFITGRDLSDTDIGNLMRAGDRFLRKPFKMELLLAEVGAMFTTKRVRAAKRTPMPKLTPARVRS